MTTSKSNDDKRGDHASTSNLPEVRAAGVLVLRCDPDPQFLLMRHPHRFDLPKGHRDAGESDRECALRELEEETGITADRIDLDADFRFEIVYYPPYRRHNYQRVKKTVVFFLGVLKDSQPIQLTEHDGYEWVSWNPPHRIQKETVDELLDAAAAHFAGTNRTPWDAE